MHLRPPRSPRPDTLFPVTPLFRSPSGGVRRSRRRCGRARSTGYPERSQHYLSGFVLTPEDADQWRAIEAAADAARGRVAETFVWALPQVMRDGFTHFDEEAEVQAFDYVLFPLALGREAEVAPGFATAIVTSAGGHERRKIGRAHG